MKAWHAGLVLLLFVAMLVPAASASGITITSDKTDYYFALGDTAAISLPVSNTYDHDIDGTLQFTTVEQLQNTGSSLTSTKNRVYTTTIPSGNTHISTSAPGPSKHSGVYPDPGRLPVFRSSATQVTLPAITVHFVQDPVAATHSRREDSRRVQA